MLTLIPAQAARASSPSASEDPPEVGAEFSVSEPSLGLDVGFPESPAVASNGTDFLAVWFNETDNRTIKGVRVTAAGEVLDVGGLRIGSSDLSARPEIAWDGTNYVVAWSEFGRILASRVSSQGAVLDPDPILLSPRSRDAWAPMIAGSPTGSLVVWQDRGDIWGTRIDPQGDVMDERAIRISRAQGEQKAPAVAWSGSEFLVAWGDERSGEDNDIFAARVAEDGTLLDTSGVPVSTAARRQSLPSVSWTGGEFRLIWEDRRSDGRPNIFTARMDPDAQVLPPGGTPVAESPGSQVHPDISSDEETSLLAWKAASGLEAVSIDEEDQSASAPQLIAPLGSAEVSTAVSGSGVYLATFLKGPFGTDGVRAVRIDSSGDVQDEDSLLLSAAFDDQFDPSVAWSGQEYLVTWANARGVFAARVASDGTMMDPDPVEIWHRHGRSPDVVWAESHYLIAWEDLGGRSPTNIFAARVDRDGQVLDDQPIHVSETPVDEYEPQVASSGATALIVWEDARSTFSKWGVSGAVLSGSGRLLNEDTLRIGAAPDYQSRPSVAWNGASYLVAWEDLRFRGKSRSDIFASRVSKAGRVLDPRGIKISGARRWQEEPSVAAAGNRFLVAWTDRCDVYGAILTKRARLRKRDIEVSAGPGCQSSPSTAQSGANYLLTWSESRPRLKDDSDLYATRVDASGTVLDPEAIELVIGAEEVWPSTDAFTIVDRAVVVYSRFVPESSHGALRAFIRTVR